MTPRLLFAPLLLVLLTGAELPVPGLRDAHIQTVFHDDDQVVQLIGALGWQITVEFAADERIETVSIGDALAWQVTPNKRAQHFPEAADQGRCDQHDRYHRSAALCVRSGNRPAPGDDTVGRAF